MVGRGRRSARPTGRARPGPVRPTGDRGTEAGRGARHGGNAGHQVRGDGQPLHARDSRVSARTVSASPRQFGQRGGGARCPRGARDDKTLAIEALRQPRIVLLASSFPPVVTATAVWLREMGLDITLVRFQAFRTDTETLVTVSQLLPVSTAVVPRGKVRDAGQEYPAIPLSIGEFSTLASVWTNVGVRGPLELCARRAGEWVTRTEICEYTGRSRAELNGDLGALTRLVKKTSARTAGR
jgi:hypothetical protein